MLNDKEAAKCLLEQANEIEQDIKNERLQPDTILGKVWQLLGELDNLSEIISKIDELAKVDQKTYPRSARLVLTR